MKKRTLVLAAVILLAAGALRAADFSVSNVGFSAYRINGNNNPELTLTRGQTYTFDISAPGHPFWIKTVASTGTANAFNTGVTNNGIDSGTLTFAVPVGAPNTLFYSCEFHAAMTGTIHVVDPVSVQPEPWSGVKLQYRN